MDISAAGPDDRLAALSYRYAAALDHRDLDSLLTVFHSSATLRAHPPGRNPMLLTGHRELAKLIKAVGFWPRTFHLVGQGLFTIDGPQAFGEVYCVANHFSSSEPGFGVNDVMYIRYEDSYQLFPDGRWLIAHRNVITDAIESREVAPVQ